MKVAPIAALLLFSVVLPTGIAPAQAGQSGQSNLAKTSPTTKLPAIVAHRGGKRWAPENSMAAFAASVEAGVDGIELDIHKCKSGELVVIHDDTLERTTNGKGYVKDKTWAELKDLDCGSWYDKSFKNERLPLLKDVLKLVDGKLTINDRRVEGSTGVIEMAHRKGLKVHTWTFRNDASGYGYTDPQVEMEVYMRLGVDGVFTDVPATGVAALNALR